MGVKTGIYPTKWDIFLHNRKRWTLYKFRFIRKIRFVGGGKGWKLAGEYVKSV